MTAKKVLTSHAPQQTHILQQDAAVVQYLESLLQEVDFAPEYAEEPAVSPEPAQVAVQTPVAPEPQASVPTVSVEAIAPEIVEPEIVEPEIVEPEIVEPEIVEPEYVEPEMVEPVFDEQEFVEQESAELEEQPALPPLPKIALPGGDNRPEQDIAPSTVNGVPYWAQGYFQCLLFKVDGLEYAAPLEWLNGILEWPDTVTELPKQHGWFVGLARNRDQNVKVVDLAQVLKMEYSSKTVSPLEQRAKYIMLINEGRWGIACDAVADVISLSDREVRWRQNPRFPWLVGTVAQEMCSLLDMEQLLSVLEQGFESIPQ